jgi:hypothetical protein
VKEIVNTYLAKKSPREIRKWFVQKRYNNGNVTQQSVPIDIFNIDPDTGIAPAEDINNIIDGK